MTITQTRKDQLQAATVNACTEMTKGMNKTQLQARLVDVQAKIKASTGFDGKPVRGLAERVEACKAEIARLQGEIAKL
jgi:hypothetical protein